MFAKAYISDRHSTQQFDQAGEHTQRGGGGGGGGESCVAAACAPAVAYGTVWRAKPDAATAGTDQCHRRKHDEGTG